MFRTYETRLGRVPSGLRGRRCSRDRSVVLGCRLPPLNGAVPAAPVSLPVPGSDNDEASARVHGCSPGQPSPRRWPPDGTGALGLFPELHTRLSRTQPRMSGWGQVLNTDPDYVLDISRPPRRTHSQRATSRRNHGLSRTRDRPTDHPSRRRPHQVDNAIRQVAPNLLNCLMWSYPKHDGSPVRRGAVNSITRTVTFLVR
jgi:hypothetical protein